MAISWARELSPSTSSSAHTIGDQSTTAPPPEKVPKLTGRAKYLLYQKASAPKQPGSQPTRGSSAIRDEMERYLKMEAEVNVDQNTGDIVEINPIKFWSESTISRDIPSLARLARNILSVPASSAPVERVFSHGGIIFRPHRRRLTDDHLSQLIFLKCNRIDI